MPPEEIQYNYFFDISRGALPAGRICWIDSLMAAEL